MAEVFDHADFFLIYVLYRGLDKGGGNNWMFGVSYESHFNTRFHSNLNPKYHHNSHILGY